MLQQIKSNKSFTICLIAIAVSLLINACTNRNQQDLLMNTVCDTADTKYAAVISPIIATSCNTQSGCHGGASLGSVSLENYQNVKDRISDIVFRINSGNMPKNNAKLSDCNIKKIESWVSKGAQNN